MNFYKIVLTRGEPVIFEESIIDKILAFSGELFKVWNKDKTKFDVIHKSHIVQIYFDHEINDQDYELIDGVYKLRKDIVK